MLGIVLIALILSAFAFRDQPPVDRAVMTVAGAWFIQCFPLGYALGGADAVWSEDALVGAAFRAALAVPVGLAFYWWFNRRWTGASYGENGVRQTNELVATRTGLRSRIGEAGRKTLAADPNGYFFIGLVGLIATAFYGFQWISSASRPPVDGTVVQSDLLVTADQASNFAEEVDEVSIGPLSPPDENGCVKELAEQIGNNCADLASLVVKGAPTEQLTSKIAHQSRAKKRSQPLRPEAEPLPKAGDMYEIGNAFREPSGEQ